MFVVMIFVVDIEIDETGTGWLEHSSSLLSSSTGIAGLTQGVFLKYLPSNLTLLLRVFSTGIADLTQGLTISRMTKI